MGTKKLEFVITSGEAGTRLDRCLSRLIPDSSRSFLQKLIRDGMVRADGAAVDVPRYPVRAGMRIEVDLPEEAAAEPSPEPFDFPILYEDESMLVIDKPPGVVVHPAAGNPTGTVVNALLGRYPQLAEELACGNSRPGIVHRLDKDTSGLILIAKNDRAHAHLSEQFKQRTMEKHYRAVAAGSFSEPAGLIDAPIARHPTDRKKMAIVPDGKPSRTEWHVLEPLCGATHLDVHLLTGRTHQIRVHMQSIGHPLLGDRIYAPHLKTAVHIPRLMLHAYSLSFTHPSTGERMTFTAPLPPAYEQILKKLASASM